MDPNWFVVSDALWPRLEGLVSGKASDRGVTAADTRLFMEAVFWRVRTGLPWRDLPSGFGNWNTVFRRFRRWARDRVFDRLFAAVSGDPDMEYALIDGTIVSVHQKAAGAQAVIPPGKHRKTQIGYEAGMYKWCHLVQNYFAKIKEFRVIATRYDKTDDSFRANINLTAILIVCQ